MMKTFIVLGILVLLCGVGVSQDKVISGTDKPTAAVMDLETEEGVSSSVSRLLSDYLRIQLSQTGKYTIVSRENMKEVLKEQKFQECNTTVCIVEAGKLLGASKMFGGSIGKVGSTYLLTLKLIDVETGVQENSVAEKCERCAEEALVNSISNIAAKISGKEVPDTIPSQPTTNNSGQKEITGKDGAVMVLIPAGEFMMGSPWREGDADEKLQHKVYLDAYYIDKCEVTVGQYRKYCEATGRSMPKAPVWGWIDSHPMVNVCWEDASAYARYYGKRLPTEAEWEKACRAGSETRYCYGDDESRLGQYAWYTSNSGNGTHPIGEKKPNAWGLYDMHGNVWEWCSDWYEGDYYSNSPIRNPLGPNTGSYRVLRGGSWFITPVSCRSAGRDWYGPTVRIGDGGFRCAASAAQ